MPVPFSTVLSFYYRDLLKTEGSIFSAVLKAHFDVLVKITDCHRHGILFVHSQESGTVSVENLRGLRGFVCVVT